MRTIPKDQFEHTFGGMVSGMRWQEEPYYYPRYRARCLAILHRFAESAPDRSLDILEIGGGQLAFLTVQLWGMDQALCGRHRR